MYVDLLHASVVIENIQFFFEFMKKEYIRLLQKMAERL